MIERQRSSGRIIGHGMPDVFVSYVEEDSAIATALSEGLEAAGYTTWCYERHSVPGPSYLAQTRDVIGQSRVFALVISRDSLGSSQIEKEVVRAHETGKRFLPILHGVTHAEFQTRQPEWAQAAGGATGIQLPNGSVRDILPRILRGLEMLQGGTAQSRTVEPARPPVAVRPTSIDAPMATGRAVRPFSKIRRAVIAVVITGIAFVVFRVVWFFHTISSSIDDIGKVESKDTIAKITAAIDEIGKTGPSTGASITVPTLNVGDEWQYASKGTNDNGAYVTTIVRLEMLDGANHYVFKSGRRETFFRVSDLAFVLDRLNGGVVRREMPALREYDWPLTVGKSWGQSNRIEHPADHQTRDQNIQWTVDAEEQVTVRAGTFRTVKITRRNKTGAIVSERWYAPDVKRWIKLREFPPSGVQERELVAYKLK